MLVWGTAQAAGGASVHGHITAPSPCDSHSKEIPLIPNHHRRARACVSMSLCMCLCLHGWSPKTVAWARSCVSVAP